MPHPFQGQPITIASNTQLWVAYVFLELCICFKLLTVFFIFFFVYFMIVYLPALLMVFTEYKMSQHNNISVLRDHQEPSTFCFTLASSQLYVIALQPTYHVVEGDSQSRENGSTLLPISGFSDLLECLAVAKAIERQVRRKE